MFLSFDVLANASSLGLFVVLLGLVRQRTSDETAADSAPGAPLESTPDRGRWGARGRARRAAASLVVASLRRG
jgi:hypothetical protein